MSLHLCTDRECSYLGQRSATGCGCHKTDDQVLRERCNVMLAALQEIEFELAKGCPDDAAAATRAVLDRINPRIGIGADRCREVL